MHALPRSFFLAAALAVSPLIAADAARASAPVPAEAWIGARPAVEISVREGAASDTYEVSAVVSDLRNDTVLARPLLIVNAGSPARIEMGATGEADAVLLALSVTVDAAAGTARYEATVSIGDGMISRHGATLAVQPRT